MLAQQLGFSDLQTTALQKLEAALQTAAQRLAAFIKERQSDSNIGAETQEAIADLNQEKFSSVIHASSSCSNMK